MANQVTCECGYVARADSDDEIVELVGAHVASEHPELVDTATEDVIRSWIKPAS